MQDRQVLSHCDRRQRRASETAGKSKIRHGCCGQQRRSQMPLPHSASAPRSVHHLLGLRRSDGNSSAVDPIICSGECHVGLHRQNVLIRKTFECSYVSRPDADRINSRLTERSSGRLSTSLRPLPVPRRSGCTIFVVAVYSRSYPRLSPTDDAFLRQRRWTLGSKVDRKSILGIRLVRRRSPQRLHRRQLRIHGVDLSKERDTKTV